MRESTEVWGSPLVCEGVRRYEEDSKVCERCVEDSKVSEGFYRCVRGSTGV